jgi:3-isopropylmalate/(R)-2-methylmalate dehydratase small subunit
MEPFTRLKAIAAPVAIANIDTDMLVPARFLKTVTKQGLAKALFAAQRFEAEGRERPDFILNRMPWKEARILITLDNFGCGSSREHAPWALLDYGIRCIIAPSFADIFYGNCFKNGILPITFDEPTVLSLMKEISRPETAILDVNLAEQMIETGSNRRLSFQIEATARDRLLNGTDDIAITLRHGGEIADYECAAKARSPWIASIPPSEQLLKA